MKWKDLMDQGIEEKVAFSQVEEEFSEMVEKEREENKILHGFAYDNRARAYMSYAQQVAEVEARAKVTRL